MAHERAEGARIGIARGVAEGAEEFHAFAGPQADAREALKVLLDPIGSVAGKAVLPTAEPEEHQLQIVAAGFVDYTVHQGEFVAAFGGFHLRPGDGGENAVQIAGGQLGPDGLDELEAGSGVVA